MKNSPRQLVTKLVSSPVLPMLGWTKTVETVIAGGPTSRWIIYAVVVTALWVVADELYQRAQEAVDDAA